MKNKRSHGFFAVLLLLLLFALTLSSSLSLSGHFDGFDGLPSKTYDNGGVGAIAFHGGTPPAAAAAAATTAQKEAKPSSGSKTTKFIAVIKPAVVLCEKRQRYKWWANVCKDVARLQRQAILQHLARLLPVELCALRTGTGKAT